MDERLKKFCICGALAVVIYGATPSCKECLSHTKENPHTAEVQIIAEFMRPIYVLNGTASAKAVTGTIILNDEIVVNLRGLNG